MLISKIESELLYLFLVLWYGPMKMAEKHILRVKLYEKPLWKSHHHHHHLKSILPTGLSVHAQVWLFSQQKLICQVLWLFLWPWCPSLANHSSLAQDKLEWTSIPPSASTHFYASPPTQRLQFNVMLPRTITISIKDRSSKIAPYDNTHMLIYHRGQF